jgi:hypothetical protein
MGTLIRVHDWATLVTDDAESKRRRDQIQESGVSPPMVASPTSLIRSVPLAYLGGDGVVIYSAATAILAGSHSRRAFIRHLTWASISARSGVAVRGSLIHWQNVARGEEALDEPNPWV